MILNKVLEVCKQHLLLRFFILWCNHQGQKFTETWPKFSASWISMQNNWKYIFGQISVKFLLSILSVRIRSDFFPQKSASVGIGQPFLENDITNQHHLRGVNMRSLADSWLYTAARISRAFWHMASFTVFWKTVVFFDVLSRCRLSAKLQAFVSVCYCGIVRVLWI